MKKILAFLLVAVMLCAAFVAPSAAAEPYINAGIEAKALEKGMAAPKIDGKVGIIEYGEPALTYSEDKEQFTVPGDDHDDYNDWDFDFYITWDKDNLYMAWVVKSAVHHPLEKGTYDDSCNKISDIWPEDGSMLGHMWWNSCIQLIITPAAPKAGKTNFAANYLEIGLCQLDDGDVGKVAWSYPVGVNADDISLNDWDAAIVRDNGAKTTTYEVAIPWTMSGIAKAGTDEQFGLSFAVAAQEDYNKVKKGMLEWNDAVLGGKKADNAGVVTLKSEEKIEVSTDIEVLVDGEQPAESEGKLKFKIDRINEKIAGEDIALKTNPEAEINTNWALALLLAPVDGKDNVYSVVASKQGDGTGEVAFDEYEDGMLILGVHSDCTDPAQGANYAGYVEKANAMLLPVGTELTLWGVDVKEGKLLYSNAIFYSTEYAEDAFINTTPGDDSSVEDSSVEESSEIEESSEEPSEEESKVTSAAESSEAEDGEGFPVWAIILIVVAVLAVVAVVVIVVLKKKKA